MIVVIAVGLIIWHLVRINSNENDESKENRMIKAVGGTIPTIEVPTEDALDNNEYKGMRTYHQKHVNKKSCTPPLRAA